MSLGDINFISCWYLFQTNTSMRKESNIMMIWLTCCWTIKLHPLRLCTTGTYHRWDINSLHRFKATVGILIQFSTPAVQILQEKYGGWQNISMVNYFNDFASLCFERFGNRVKYWITFNNPWVCQVEGKWCIHSLLNIYNVCMGTFFFSVDCCGGIWNRGTCTGTEAEGNRSLQSCSPHHQGGKEILFYFWETISSHKANVKAALEWHEPFSLSLQQAHAKVWHTYDIQWRSKQKGKKKNFICVTEDKFPPFIFCTVKLPCVSRSGRDLANGWLGWTSGHLQPEGHWSSREIPPVLRGLVCYSHLPWRLPPGYERLHR